MITLGKFNTLKEKTLPALLTAASQALDADLNRDRDTLVEVVDNMDQIVFDEFVKRRGRNLVQVMEEGILHSGIDWLNTSKPTGQSFLPPSHVLEVRYERASLTSAEVRAYMHKAILSLVETHAKISDVVPALVDRVLVALVTQVTEVALHCFQQVPKYGTGGMLTVSPLDCLCVSPPCLQITAFPSYRGALLHPPHDTARDSANAYGTRPRSKLSSSTSRSTPTSRHRPTTRSQKYTTRSRKRTAGRSRRTISTASWRG